MNEHDSITVSSASKMLYNSFVLDIISNILLYPFSIYLEYNSSNHHTEMMTFHYYRIISEYD